MRKNKILFIHNKAINYRISLFQILKKHFKENIEFWFYGESKQKEFPGKYFSFIRFKINFSFSCVWNLLRTNHYDIVILSGSHSYELPFLFLILKIKKTPIIFWTETWNWKPMNLKNKFFLKIISKIAQNSDLVIYPGKKVKELYDSIGISSEKQIFAPNSSKLEEEIDLKYIEYLNLSKKKYNIGFAARNLPMKGLKYLIEAFIELPRNKYSLIIGSDDKILKEKFKKNKSIKFIGYIPREKLFSFFYSIDLFVYPSINLNGMSEAWGLTINESIQSDTPCISTSAVAASYNLIRDGKNGFIVKEKNSKAILKAIQKIEKISPKIITKTNNKISRLHTYENMAKGFIKAIEITRNYK
jgi:glycosyltransferase involved in cell wall biosynthesis